MPSTQRNALRLTALLGLATLCLTGCQAERSVIAPTKPTWSYHDDNVQLSNNDQWQQMIPDSPFAGIGTTQVATVEDLQR